MTNGNTKEDSEERQSRSFHHVPQFLNEEQFARVQIAFCA